MHGVAGSVAPISNYDRCGRACLAVRVCVCVCVCVLCVCARVHLRVECVCACVRESVSGCVDAPCTLCAHAYVRMRTRLQATHGTCVRRGRACAYVRHSCTRALCGTRSVDTPVLVAPNGHVRQRRSVGVRHVLRLRAFACVSALACTAVPRPSLAPKRAVHMMEQQLHCRSSCIVAFGTRRRAVVLPEHLPGVQLLRWGACRGRTGRTLPQRIAQQSKARAPRRPASGIARHVHARTSPPSTSGERRLSPWMFAPCTRCDFLPRCTSPPHFGWFSEFYLPPSPPKSLAASTTAF